VGFVEGESAIDMARLLKTIVVSVLTAAILAGLTLLLPTTDYQRWELASRQWYSQLLWIYERIRFDPTPIDVAIIGSSKIFLGVDPVRLEQRLSELKVPAHAANLAKLGAGRNVDLSIVKELFASKKPRVLVVGIEDRPYPWGHPGFPDVATPRDLLAPPAPFMRDYLGNLAGLPKRQVLLFAGRLFPELFGLHVDFDAARHDAAIQPWKADDWLDDLVTVNRNAVRPVETLVAERRPLPVTTGYDRLLLKCCNDGDERVYLRAIVNLAKEEEVRLLFVHVPMFEGAQTAEEDDFVRSFGRIVDGGEIQDLRSDPSNFENWRHFNRIGAQRLTDRIAPIVASLELEGRHASVRPF
jgi:hypothetical protein